MNWKTLSTATDLQEVLTASEQTPQVIFKHSTRCTISTVIKNRLAKSETTPQIEIHYLDLIAHRDISNLVADTFSVAHESPQVLLIKNRACIFDESHLAIHMDEIMEQAFANS